MAVQAGSATVDINANLAPYLAGIEKAKSAADEFVRSTQSGFTKAAAAIAATTAATASASAGFVSLSANMIKTIAVFTAISTGISFATAQLKDLTTTGDTATEKLQRGFIELSGQAVLMRISLAGFTSGLATSLATLSTYVAGAGAVAAAAVYGLRALTSSVVEQYQAIQEAKEEAKEYEEQLKALSDVARGLRGVTGGVLTPFALQHGTGGDIGPAALEAATDLLPEITKRMGDAGVASQALATALRNPTQAFEALRLAGITFTEEQRALLREVDTVTERFEAQSVIIRALQEQLFIQDDVAQSGWSQLSGTIADLVDRFMSMKSPLQLLREWIDKVYAGFLRWFEFRSFFDWLNAQLISATEALKEFNKYWFPRAGIETIDAYEQQIKDIQDRLQALRNNVAGASNVITRSFYQALLTAAEETAPEAIQRIRNSADYIKNQIDALGEAYRAADNPMQAYLRFLERQAEAEQRLYVPMRQRLEILRQSATAAEAQARIQLIPLEMSPGTPEYIQALRTVLALTGAIADEQARVAGNTPFDRELRALTEALIAGDEAAKRLFESMRELPATIAAGTRALQDRLQLMRDSTDRHEQNARAQLESLVQQGLLIQGSEQYNRALRERTALFRSIAAEERRIALATSGKLTIFERENLRLEQQVQLFRYGSQEMSIQNRLLQIRIAAIQAQQPLDEQQTRQIEQRLRQLAQLQQVTSTVNEAVGSVFNSLANQIADFAVTGKFKMKDFADEVVKQLVRIALQAMVVKPILDAISGFTNTYFGEAISPGSTTSQIQLGRHASGGEFTVPGRNRGDQPYLIGLSGGERVNVTPPGQNGGGSGNITVINNVQSSREFEVQQTERQGEGGQKIIEQTFTEVMRRIGRGDGDNTFGARFGVRPRTVQR